MRTTTKEGAAGAGEAPAAPLAPRRPGWTRGQIGVRGLALLVLAVALATAIAINRQRVAELRPRIEQLRPVARRLEVTDPRQLAAVAALADFSEDEAWDVHVPAGPGPGHRLCVALARIEATGTAPATQSALIAPGRHRLTLVAQDTVQGTHYAILDGVDPVLRVEDPRRYMLSGGSSFNRSVGGAGLSGGTLRGSSVQDNTQSPADRPLVLCRRRFTPPTPTNPYPATVLTGPAEGLLLWIEPAGPAAR